MTREFKFPSDVQGWLTEEEGRALYDLAKDKEVLELGCWKGRSTICLAQSAKHVVCVDNFQGDAGVDQLDPKHGDPRCIESEFRANVRVTGACYNVTLLVNKTTDVSIVCRYDLVFVDGAHDYESVCDDLRVAVKAIKPGGVIVLHDFKMTSVQNAAAEVLGWNAPHHDEVIVDSVYGLYARPYTQRDPKPKVFLAIPHRNNVSSGTVTGIINALGQRSLEVVKTQFHSSSLLTACFNSLWCEALNGRKELGLTHFVMNHDDVIPEDGWLQKMYFEMRKHDADIISCVIAIKDPRGLTSTAVVDPATKVMRRLTVHECLKMPKTFTASDLGPDFQSHQLLVNTGLWMCDFTKPWVEEVCFQQRDRIVYKDGVFKCQPFSEDWVFSKWACERGLKVVATNAVQIKHQGIMEYPNFADWGAWKTDQAKDEYDPPAQVEDFPIPNEEKGWDKKIQDHGKAKPAALPSRERQIPKGIKVTA